jgi:hypothetical protein
MRSDLTRVKLLVASRAQSADVSTPDEKFERLWKAALTLSPQLPHFSQRNRQRAPAPVFGWFTEGFDTRDPKEAKALLDHLA